MSQLELFGELATIPSPLCFYEHCTRQGRATVGPADQRSPTCVNYALHCLTCGATGIKSVSTAPPKRKAA
jgi:hypothetical protein